MSKVGNAVPKKRGPDELYSDTQMKELAIKIKKKYKQKKLSYLLLEKESGISRNTWKRRLENYIQELNNPIIRNFENVESDEIYFPNIESIFEAYGENQSRIISELHHFELLFQDLYKERNKLKEDLKKLEDSKDIINSQNDQIAALKSEVAHYKTLYEQLIANSIDLNSRRKLDIKENLVDFNKNLQQNVSLNNLDCFFPEVSKEGTQDEEENILKLKGKFDKLF